MNSLSHDIAKAISEFMEEELSPYVQQPKEERVKAFVQVSIISILQEHGLVPYGN